MAKSSRARWKVISRSKRNRLESSLSNVPSSWDDISLVRQQNVTNVAKETLPEATVKITERSTEDLVQMLAQGDLTSVEVTKAFLLRAKLASKLVNCITELMPESALHRATFLDAHLCKTGKPMGPLHGLPISVKEHMGIKGLDCNAGFAAWMGNVAKANATIAELLLAAGCVLYARTTEPPGLMALETSSNLYGVTSNPYNTTLTAGGSSGGEGALISLKGSCLGVGTDIGGSIRVPAAHNGIFGLKPTAGRLPLKGFVAIETGPMHVLPVAGPMSNSLEGINLFMRAVLNQRPWEDNRGDSLLERPWSIQTSLSDTHVSRNIRVGFMSNDGVVTPHKPIKRAMMHLRAVLGRDSRFDVFDFPPYDHKQAWRIACGCYFPDGGKRYIDTINASEEPVGLLTDFIINQNPYVRERDAEEMLSLVAELQAYKLQYQEHWDMCFGASERINGIPDEENDETSLPQRYDILVTPATPGCAPKHGHTRYWGYTAQWNLMGYPSIVFPTGLDVEPKDEPDDSYEPWNEQDAYNHSLYSRKDFDEYKGLPICLQIVGRTGEDEIVLLVTKLISECLQRDADANVH